MLDDISPTDNLKSIATASITSATKRYVSALYRMHISDSISIHPKPSTVVITARSYFLNQAMNDSCSIVHARDNVLQLGLCCEFVFCSKGIHLNLVQFLLHLSLNTKQELPGTLLHAEVSDALEPFE